MWQMFIKRLVPTQVEIRDFLVYDVLTLSCGQGTCSNLTTIHLSELKFKCIIHKVVVHLIL